MTTVVKLGMFCFGAALVFGGRNATGSLAFTPARHFMEAFGVAPAHGIHAWGYLFIGVGGISALHGCLGTPTRRGVVMVIIGSVWTLWAGMLASYSLSHQGLGLPGAVLYATIALLCYPLGLGWIAYARDLEVR